MYSARSDASTSTDDIMSRPLWVYYFYHPVGVVSASPPLVSPVPRAPPRLPPLPRVSPPAPRPPPPAPPRRPLLLPPLPLPPSPRLPRRSPAPRTRRTPPAGVLKPSARPSSRLSIARRNLTHLIRRTVRECGSFGGSVSGSSGVSFERDLVTLRGPSLRIHHRRTSAGRPQDETYSEHKHEYEPEHEQEYEHEHEQEYEQEYEHEHEQEHEHGYEHEQEHAQCEFSSEVCEREESGGEAVMAAGGRGAVSSGLMLRRYSAPETLMRRYHLAQESSVNKVEECGPSQPSRRPPTPLAPTVLEVAVSETWTPPAPSHPPAPLLAPLPDLDQYVADILLESLNSLTDQIESINTAIAHEARISVVQKEIKVRLQNTGVNTLVHLSPDSNNQIIFGNEELCNTETSRDARSGRSDGNVAEETRPPCQFCVETIAAVDGGSDCGSLVDSLEEAIIPHTPPRSESHPSPNSSPHSTPHSPPCSSLRTPPQQSSLETSCEQLPRALTRERAEAFYVRFDSDQVSVQSESEPGVAGLLPEEIKARLRKREQSRQRRAESARCRRRRAERRARAERAAMEEYLRLVEELVTRTVLEELRRAIRTSSRHVVSAPRPAPPPLPLPPATKYRRPREPRPPRGKLALQTYSRLPEERPEPQRIYQKSEIHEGNNCIEILEILEYIDSPQNSPESVNYGDASMAGVYSRKKKSKIPIPVAICDKYEKPLHIKPLQIFTTSSIQSHLVNSPEVSDNERTNRFIASLLMESLCEGEPVYQQQRRDEEPSRRGGAVRFRPRGVHVIPEESGEWGVERRDASAGPSPRRSVSAATSPVRDSPNGNSVIIEKSRKETKSSFTQYESWGGGGGGGGRESGGEEGGWTVSVRGGGKTALPADLHMRVSFPPAHPATPEEQWCRSRCTCAWCERSPCCAPAAPPAPPAPLSAAPSPRPPPRPAPRPADNVTLTLKKQFSGSSVVATKSMKKSTEFLPRVHTFRSTNTKTKSSLKRAGISPRWGGGGGGGELSVYGGGGGGGGLSVYSSSGGGGGGLSMYGGGGLSVCGASIRPRPKPRLRTMTERDLTGLYSTRLY